MPPPPPAPGPALSAAALNEEIRAFTRGRSWWSSAALADLRVMQAAYLEAQRAEQAAGLGRGDVAEAA